ncbi:Ethanolamine kinase [Neofusicoccum parvum]|uniref:ethanolamine kinase n=1 Tax=Botryosphaeria parva (strain UCR-NP2) TaxID=1287680 RepID=R1E7I5_BOTPV|nr:putative ethanolamine kinase protein [Neofusicoccum parvum UCRNP2]GME66258.1 Ethanolamine kinase [Neofusicoccum parvum]
MDHDALPYIPLRYDGARAHDSALELVLALRPEWTKTQDTIDFVRFTDGITNTLFKAINKLPGLSDEQIDREAVLMRAYGRGTDVLIDRERETRSHSLLARHKLAPPLLARFENGLLYKFIEGSVCSPPDLRRQEVWRGVARRLGQWHATLPISYLITEIPSDDPSAAAVDDRLHRRKSSWLEAADNITPDQPSPNLWTVMQKWIHSLPHGSDAEKKRKATLQQELIWLVSRLSSTPGISANPLVFCHCDLLSGNVIVEPQPSTGESPASTAESNATDSSLEAVSVDFIDYEYATPAPAAFDISNHFAEWGGFDCDFNCLPTRSERRDFIREYVSSYSSHLPQPLPQADIDAKAEQLYREVDDFRGVPGFYWGIWALIQAKISQIDFDYASYAEVRLGEYWAWKAELLGTRAGELPLRERRWAEK